MIDSNFPLIFDTGSGTTKVGYSNQFLPLLSLIKLYLIYHKFFLTQ
jgi:hypothetical protein